MKKALKKGFTLVELLVVIAILAILATVSIVGYSSFINKANKSADEQAVVQMNKVLMAAEVTDGKPEDFIEVKKVLRDNGYNDTFETYYTEYLLGWIKADNVVVLISKESGSVVFPEEYVGKQAEPFNVKYIEGETAFQEAITKLDTENASVVLSEDLNLSQVNEITIQENQKLEIDLNGNELKGDNLTDDQLLYVKGNGTVIITNGNIDSNQDLIYIHENSDVTLKGVTFNSTSADYYAIGTNGSDGANATVTIEDCTLKARNVLFIPSGTWTIKNSKIEGRSNICGGNVTIESSTFLSSGTSEKVFNDYGPSSAVDAEKNFIYTNNYITFGDALLISVNKEGYNLTKVVIKDSTFGATDAGKATTLYGLRIIDCAKNENAPDPKTVVLLENNTYNNHESATEKGALWK